MYGGGGTKHVWRRGTKPAWGSVYLPDRERDIATRDALDDGEGRQRSGPVRIHRTQVSRRHRAPILELGGRRAVLRYPRQGKGKCTVTARPRPPHGRHCTASTARSQRGHIMVTARSPDVHPRTGTTQASHGHSTAPAKPRSRRGRSTPRSPGPRLCWST